MKNSFGQQLLGKNYIVYLFRKIRWSNLWQTADRIIKYLSKILWIRRLFTIIVTVTILIEQSLMVLFFYSLSIIFFPIWLIDFLIQRILNSYRYRLADKILFSHGKGTWLLWSSSKEKKDLENSFFMGCVKEYLKQEMTIIIILPKASMPFLWENDFSILYTTPSYFFHLRKRIRKQSGRKTIFIYE